MFWKKCKKVKPEKVEFWFDILNNDVTNIEYVDGFVTINYFKNGSSWSIISEDVQYDTFMELLKIFKQKCKEV